MGNNSTFIYLGAFLAVVGIALVVFGAMTKTKTPSTTWLAVQ